MGEFLNMQALCRPPLSRGLSRDFCPALRAELVSTRGSTLPAEPLGGFVLARTAGVLLDLARQNLGDADRVGDGIGGALQWPDEMVREALDHILADRETFKLRLKGVRTDTVGFAKFGIPMDRVNSGLYQGIPVVIAEVPFDRMEFVFEPEGRPV
jgi:hypothetical protein